MWQRKATGPQSHTSSRERHTMGENNVSTSTNTVELRISGAFLSEARRLAGGRYQRDYLKATRAKHTLWLPNPGGL